MDSPCPCRRYSERAGPSSVRWDCPCRPPTPCCSRCILRNAQASHSGSRGPQTAPVDLSPVLPRFGVFPCAAEAGHLVEPACRLPLQTQKCRSPAKRGQRGRSPSPQMCQSPAASGSECSATICSHTVEVCAFHPTCCPETEPSHGRSRPRRHSSLTLQVSPFARTQRDTLPTGRFPGRHPHWRCSRNQSCHSKFSASSATPASDSLVPTSSTRRCPCCRWHLRCLRG